MTTIWRGLGLIALTMLVTTAFFMSDDENLRPVGISYLRCGIPHSRPQLRLYMGTQPGPVKCPKGKYRPPGAGPSLGECRPCPRGVYGDSPGLTSSDCTAKCPKGTYNDKLGAKSILDCQACPAGVYGSAPGLTTRACTAPCPEGKYSMRTGLQSVSECLDCMANYRGPQGHRGNNPVGRRDGGYPCNRYISGKSVISGRSADIEFQLDAYLNNPRFPKTKINDNVTP